MTSEQQTRLEQIQKHIDHLKANHCNMTGHRSMIEFLLAVLAEREIERLARYDCPIRGHDVPIHDVPEGVGNPKTPILCPHCAGELRVELNRLRLDIEAEKDRGDGWKLQCEDATRQRDALRAQRDALVEALEKIAATRAAGNPLARALKECAEAALAAGKGEDR